jgi:hypothetical protein
MSNTLDVALRWLGKRGKRRCLIDAVETGYGVWHDNDALPG